MQYHHLYSDETGESHWRTVDVALTEKTFAPPAKAIEISEGEAARAVLFLRLATGWSEPVHTTPKRQYYVCLSGRVRVTASDGDTREIGPRDVWRMEDTHGKGHHTEVISDDPATAVMVQFD